MPNLVISDEEVKNILKTSKSIAMIGVSAIKKEDVSNIKRRPSTIVMKYMQEFGYRVIPVNPFSSGKELYGETIVSNLSEIKIPIDIVDVFRPSIEAEEIAKQALNIKAKTLWLQYGIHNEEAKKISNKANMNYVSNKCIKQEYQKFFLKINPVFPALKN
jgi:uncharacterized protein